MRRPGLRNSVISQLPTSGYGTLPRVISSHSTTPNDHCSGDDDSDDDDGGGTQANNNSALQTWFCLLSPVVCTRRN